MKSTTDATADHLSSDREEREMSVSGSAITAYPIPEGVDACQRGILENSEAVIEVYQFGAVVVALAHADLIRLEVKSVKLGMQALPARLLGFGASASEGCCWCSLLLDPDLYLGHSPSELTFEFWALADDDE